MSPADEPRAEGGQAGGDEAPAAATSPSQEHSVAVVLSNRYGLHMRPAKRVMEVAYGFRSQIDLVANGQEVDAKSILGIIGLGAECGDEVVVRARGPDAREAAEELGKLLASLPELHGEPRDIG